jgi:hypothetical protein
MPMNDLTNIFVEKQKEFLSFLKSRFNVFHESNVFFRDLHYGVMAFLQMNGLPNRYSVSEELTKQVVAAYEQERILIRIDDRSWMLNYLPFKKPLVRVAVPVKSATPLVKQVPSTSPSIAAVAQQNVVARPIEVQGGITA